MEAISLYELNALVRRHLATAFPDEYWVQAEMSDVRTNATGHCYLELVEKDERGNGLLAKAKAIIWSQTYRLLKPYFEQETGQAFVSGIKVLVKVTVGFHELYGYTLTVVDIDPSYTLGDMARRRREILNRLKKEGVINLNKELVLPSLPQRIAVISSATAAGYDDFCNQLVHNPYGYVFYTKLFAAVMQGEKVEESIIAALDQIYDQIENWDVVVIIRGGGATSDLSNFDSYMLAASCAQFPLPIITGIGHERDDTVIDAVVHTRVKTPTAAAEFLISHIHRTTQKLDDLIGRAMQGVTWILDNGKQQLERCIVKLPILCSNNHLNESKRIKNLSHKICIVTESLMIKEEYKVERLYARLVGLVQNKYDKECYRLQLLEERLNASSPERILAKGYSLTLKDSRVITDVSEINIGDRLITRVAKGEIYSIVKSIKKE